MIGIQGNVRVRINVVSLDRFLADVTAFQRALRQSGWAVDHLKVHVLAHISYLPSQQIGEGGAIRRRVVVAALFVGQQRIRRDRVIK